MRKTESPFSAIETFSLIVFTPRGRRRARIEDVRTGQDET
jgi:hypothetical protein